MPICKDCKEDLPEEMFYHFGKDKQNRYLFCKNCRKKRYKKLFEKWNKKRKEKYKSDEDYRKKIQNAMRREYWENSENRLKQKKEYYQKNKEKIRIKNLERDKLLRLEVIKEFGGKCEICGISDEEVLEFDHIVPIRKSGKKRDNSRIARRARKNPELFQLLCANCHTKKTKKEMRECYEKRRKMSLLQ